MLFFSCSTTKKEANKNIQPNNKASEVSEDQSRSATDLSNQFSDQQLNFEIKKMLSEINYLKEKVTELDVKSSLYADPFSIYNKEIILNNGSSIFCKILSQDANEIFVETLIGNLTINRTNVVRIVENIIVLEDNIELDAIIEISQDEEIIVEDSNVITQRQQQSSASIILMGDIEESKDKSGNTILKGRLKNIGTERGDLVRIDFILRKNFQGDVTKVTAYASGSSHVFKNSGIVSNSSIKPGAIGEFKVIIPNNIGNFIGYSYELYWDHYE